MNEPLDANNETLDNEPLDENLDFEAMPLSDEARKSYANKLLLLSEIHGEIAPELNRKRELAWKVLHSADDRYIPEKGESLIDLMLDSERVEAGIEIATPDTDWTLAETMPSPA